MLLVQTKLNLSKIEGIGLFADEFIPRDTIIWKYHPMIDLRFPEEGLVSLSSSARAQIKKYCYRDKDSGLYVLCGDDARFFNHSASPNCLDTYEKIAGLAGLQGITFTIRDIERGEELTCDYSLFDKDFVKEEYETPVESRKEAAVTV